MRKFRFGLSVVRSVVLGACDENDPDSNRSDRLRTSVSPTAQSSQFD
jgi:hypothetical protein